MHFKPQLLPSIFLAMLLGMAGQANALDAKLLEMSDQMDKIDKQDFQASIARATSCTRTRNFTCAESELSKAAKSVNTEQDRKALAASRQSLANERQQLAMEIKRAEEARLAQLRREEEERQAAIREEEERQARQERQEQMARDAEERQSTREAWANVGATIVQRGREMGAMQNKFDRNFNVAMAETNRRLAAQAAERDRARAERDEREAERNAAERDRQARAEADRRARVEAAKPTTTDFPKYQPQVATIGTVSDKCPPGSSPARQANGLYVTIPPTAYCIKDTQSTNTQTTAQSAQNGTVVGTTVNSGNVRQSSNNGSGSNRSNENGSSKVKEIEWGPIKLEAVAICNQSPKSSKWQCYGPVQNEPFHDGATLESSLAGQNCAGGTWAAGGPILDGVQWQAYRCGHSLGYGDNDVATRYSLVTARRSYICPKNQLGDGQCSTIYDGQDKR